MRSIAYQGEGINRKTNERIRFKVPEGLSGKGQDAFARNVDVTKISHSKGSAKSDSKFVYELVGYIAK